MNSKPEGAGARACWFVGATYGGTDDQTLRFLQEGIWENGYQDKYLDAVKSIQVGDRIAIKSSYTRKHDLPFDNRGQTVSVMAIKAIGTVKENLGDGRTLKVDWKPFDPPREWYFYTNRSTVWRVLPGDWTTDALIGFTFEEKAQDINRFRNAPYWRERFGDSAVDKRRFNWTRFYEAVADKLLTFRNRRDELIAGIHVIASKVDGLSNLQDQFADGSSGPLKDICPFTAMGIFNRGITDANRKAIASELASLLGVSEPVPDSFEGIPILNNQKSCFSGSTTNANQMTLTPSGRPLPRQLLLRNRMTRRRGRHLSQPTTTRRSAMVWDGTLPWGCTGFVPGISRPLMVSPSVRHPRPECFWPVDVLELAERLPGGL